MSKGFNVSYTISLIDKFTKNARSTVASLRTVKAAQQALNKVKGSQALANALNAGSKSAKAFSGAMHSTASSVAASYAKMSSAANKFNKNQNRYGNSQFHKDMARITKIQAARSITAMGGQLTNVAAGALMPSDLTAMLTGMPDMIEEYEQSLVELKRAANASDADLKRINTLAFDISSKMGVAPKEVTDVVGIVAKTGASLGELLQVQKESGQTYVETLSKFLKSDTGMDAEATGAAVENFRRVMKLTIPQTQEFMNQVAALADATAAGQADLLATLKDSQGLYAALGMSKDQALTFSGVSAQAGVYGNQAGRLAKNMQARLTAVAGGNATKSQKRAMALIGLDSKKLMGAMNKSPFDAMVAVIKTIGTKNLTKAERVNVYMDLFGKEFGAKMATFGLIFEKMEKPINDALTTGAKGKVDKEAEAFKNTIKGQVGALGGDLLKVGMENKDVILGFIEGIRDTFKTVTPALNEMTKLFGGDKKAVGKGLFIGLVALTGVMAAFKTIETINTFKLVTKSLFDIKGLFDVAGKLFGKKPPQVGWPTPPSGGGGLLSKAGGALKSAGTKVATAGGGLLARAGGVLGGVGVAALPMLGKVGGLLSKVPWGAIGGVVGRLAGPVGIALLVNDVIKLTTGFDVLGTTVQRVFSGELFTSAATHFSNQWQAATTAVSNWFMVMESNSKTHIMALQAQSAGLNAWMANNPAKVSVQTDEAMANMLQVLQMKNSLASSINFSVNGRINMPSMPSELPMVPGRGGGRANIPGPGFGGPLQIHVSSASGLNTSVTSPGRGTNMKVTKK
jgi:TP901 family phage tail tape measure protein